MPPAAGASQLSELILTHICARASRTQQGACTVSSRLLQIAAHEVRRAVANPGAQPLLVATLHLEDSGVAELQLQAGGESFSGSTQIVRVAGLPTATVAGRPIDLNGWYPVNPSGCGKLQHPGSHFRIKLPKRAAEAAAVAIQQRVQQRLVTVT